MRELRFPQPQQQTFQAHMIQVVYDSGDIYPTTLIERALLIRPDYAVVFFPASHHDEVSLVVHQVERCSEDSHYYWSVMSYRDLNFIDPRYFNDEDWTTLTLPELINKYHFEGYEKVTREQVIASILESRCSFDPNNCEGLVKVGNPEYEHLFATNHHNQGFFLICGKNGFVRDLDIRTYPEIVEEAKRAGVTRPYEVWGKFEALQTKSVRFHKVEL